MSLPIFKSEDKDLMLMQNSWKSKIDPALELPMTKGFIIPNVILNVGVNVINHKLGRKQQGWIISDINAAATLFRSAAFNDTTLTLTSNAVALANIWVF